MMTDPSSTRSHSEQSPTWGAPYDGVGKQAKPDDAGNETPEFGQSRPQRRRRSETSESSDQPSSEE